MSYHGYYSSDTQNNVDSLYKQQLLEGQLHWKLLPIDDVIEDVSLYWLAHKNQAMGGEEKSN